MAITVIVHFTNEDPLVAEMEELPAPNATTIMVVNPRRRDGKALYYITEPSASYLFAMHRISFIEVMGSAEETEVVEFFRE